MWYGWCRICIHEGWGEDNQSLVLPLPPLGPGPGWGGGPCHEAPAGSFHDNKTLAVKYNTLDALLELEEIRKFIKWISKRAVRTRRPNW